jgi:hypothetical protein
LASASAAFAAPLAVSASFLAVFDLREDHYDKYPKNAVTATPIYADASPQ